MSEIARWPESEIRLLETYLAYQPAPEERVEIAIANFHATYINAHLKQGAPNVKVTALLPYLEPWQALSDARRYSDLDREVLGALR